MPDVISAQPPPSLPEQIINSPYLWVVIILIIVYFIVAKWKGDKKRPEEEPFYGMKVRRAMTDKQLSNHMKMWGEKVKRMNLFRGFVKVGVIVIVDPLFKYPNEAELKELGIKTKEEGKILETYAIGYRKAGLMGLLKYMFLGKFDKLLIDPKGIEIDYNNKRACIDPKLHLLDDSSIWSTATNKENMIINDMNMKADHENVKGFVSDFPRRLSNLHPNQAVNTEAVSHHFAEEEKAKKARIGQWAGNK